MTPKEELIAYIRSLSAEEAKEALLIASAWLSELQEAKQHPRQKESLPFQLAH